MLAGYTRDPGLSGSKARRHYPATTFGYPPDRWAPQESGTTFAFIKAPTLGWLSPVVLAMVLLGVAGLAVLLQHAAHNVHQQPDIRAGVSFAGRRSASASPRDASTVLRFISATARRSPCSAMSSPDWQVTGETGNLGLLGKAGQVTALRGQRQLQ
jgi:hypothetical protein